MAYQETPAARLRALRQRWEADRTSRVFLQLAEEYRRQGMPREALPVLEEGLRHHASSIAGQVALGRCRLELGQAEGAAAILEKVVERDPTQMVAYRTLVDAYTKLGASGEARDRLSHYAQLNPQDPEIEALDGQIAVLERAWTSGTPPAARTGADPLETLGETSAPAEPDAAPATPSQGPEEMVAALWPAQPAESPLAGAWSTSIDAGWIPRAPASPQGAGTVQASAPQASPIWSSGMVAGGEPPAVSSLQSVPPPPEVLETEAPSEAVAPGARSEESPEAATAQLSLAELRESGAIPSSVGWRQRIGDGLPSWFEPSAAPPPPADPPASAWNRFEPELPARGDSYSPPPVQSDSDDAVGAALAAAPAVPRSWSSGESEIVFSLPPNPLLRLVDLALVPWRPLATPVWSRPGSSMGTFDGGIVARIAPPAASTPTLAQLYLEQGHAEEAAEMFEQVLEREPDNPVARAGLERVERERVRLTARSLLSGFDSGGGLSAKQAHVLRRWAALLREAHSRDAP